MSRRVIAVYGALLLACSAVAGEARAQSAAPPPAASTVDHFQEAMALFKRGEIAPACRAFERSYAEDAAPGTLFNMAVCHQQEGRVADAYHELDSLARRAEAAGRSDQAKGMRARAATLQPQLARLELLHRSPARSQVTSVSLDGLPLLADEWSRPLYVSLHVHALSFRYADGSQVSRTTAALAAGSTTSVFMEQAALRPPLTSADATVSPAASRPGRFAATVATAATGLALVATGTVFGLSTFAKRDDAESACPTRSCTTMERQHDAVTALSDAKVDATLSTVSFAAGGAALAVSLVLFLTGRRSEARGGSTATASRWQVSVAGSSTGGGAWLGAHFE